MGDHGEGRGPNGRPPMSNSRFFALLVFALLVIIIVCGTVTSLLK